MTRWILAAGAAALALALPAQAEKGGHGGGERGAVKADRANADRDGASLAARDKGGDHRSSAGPRSTDRVAVKAARRDDAGLKARDKLDGDDFDGDRRDRGRFSGDWRHAGLVGGCPPGLDAKNNGCLPPGLAKKLDIGDRLPADYYSSGFMPRDYRDLYRGTPDYYYRSDQNYIYRVDRANDLVSGLIPLLGGGYGVGQMLPAGYDFYNVPVQYRSLYPDQDNYYYRYGDNAIYRVDRSNNLIDQVVALLAGDLAVGSPLPLGYDVYNVPTQYRDRYADSADSWYRYNDSNIYRVDPTTRLIQAVISAIV